MKETSVTVTSQAYSISSEDQRSIDAWMSEHIRPSILIHTPMHDVGERELVHDLSEASYRLQGFRDARRRHFISRRLPRPLSDVAFARFCDQAFNASEVSDGFRGVDSIDITDWLGHRCSQEDTQWQRLVLYVQDHPETDFVFLAYGDGVAANSLASSISSSSGNAVLSIGLDHPSPEQLADAFVAQNPRAFASHRDDIVASLSARAADGNRLTYSSIRAAAVAATHSAAIRPDIHQAIEDALRRMAGSTSHKSTFGIGFTGGVR